MKNFFLLFIILCFGIKVFSQVPVSSFGANPGNLGMYVYESVSATTHTPLVLVMHGCTQNALGFASESGWNDLADRYGFHVIYAEQKSSNNSSQCFNWFENDDINRGTGEALSLKSMVDYMKSHYSIDDSRVFVAGFSAGGAMVSVMLAAYPDVFAAGAVMSGLPYKVALGSNEAFMAMFGNINKSPQQLGNLVRGAFPSFSGKYPRLATFHGTSDYTVYFVNQRELMEQWTNVHGADQNPDQEEMEFGGNSVVSRQIYNDQDGNDIVTVYSIGSMGHAIAVDPGNGEKQGGQAGSYAKDVNFFSSYWASVFFGIVSTSVFDAPDNVNADAISSSEVQLSWKDNATTETAYLIERSLLPDTDFASVVTLEPNTTNYSNTGLAPETVYYYRIVAVNDMGERAVSSIVSATTLAEGDDGSLIIIDQPIGAGVLSYLNSQHMGQSFTAVTNGRMETLSFNLVNAISGSSIRIYEGNTVTGQPFFEQSGLNKGKGWQTIVLDNGPILAYGHQYIVQLTNASIKYNYSNVYQGGNLWYNDIAYTVFDAAFKVEIRETQPVEQLIVRENEFLDGFYSFPNPATDKVLIKGNYQKIEHVSLVSQEGTLVTPRVNKNNEKLEIDIHDMRRGIYYLNMIIDGKHYREKIIITN